MKTAKHTRTGLVFLLIIVSLLVSGCWDNHELNKLSIVTGLGWDMDPHTRAVTLTYQSIIPSRIKNPSSSGQDGGQKGGNSMQTIQLDRDTGSSPYDVLNRFTQHGSRIPFYQHTQVYVFGKPGAQQGIYPFFDTIARNPVSRPEVLMVVSDQKASDILEVQDGMENIQAYGMYAEIRLSAEFSKYPAVTVLEFQNRLMSKSTAPIAPVIGAFEEIGAEGKKQKRIRIKATAVFKKDRMIGELNERESSGLLWAINKIKKGFVIIPEASFEIVQAKSKIVPELSDGNIKVTVEIKEESNLVQYNQPRDITDAILKQLEQRQAQEIKNQVMAAVQKSFVLNADVFGFGEAVHRKYKMEWRTMEPRWDEIYPNIEVEVKVKTHLNEIGDVSKAVLK